MSADMLTREKVLEIRRAGVRGLGDDGMTVVQTIEALCDLAIIGLAGARDAGVEAWPVSLDEVQRDLQALADSLGKEHDSLALIDHVIERLCCQDAAIRALKGKYGRAVVAPAFGVTSEMEEAGMSVAAIEYAHGVTRDSVARIYRVMHKLSPHAHEDGRDAARYRWLRSEDSDPLKLFEAGACEQQPHLGEWVGDLSRFLANEELDAAIDAALPIREGGKGEGDDEQCD